MQYTGTNLGPFDSDSEVIINPQQTLLFAVNAGSDSIAVFSIKENGTLAPWKALPFPLAATIQSVWRLMGMC